MLVVAEVVILTVIIIIAALLYASGNENYAGCMALATAVLYMIAMIRRSQLKKIEKEKRELVDKLALFAKQGSDLIERMNEDPLPVDQANGWVEEIEKYFNNNNRRQYITRLNDFTGMFFYGNGSDASQYEKALSGRIRRLHEFIQEIKGAEGEA